MPPEDSSPSADPRELARQLAEKAKARALAQQLVEQAKAAAAPAAAAPAAPPPKKSLADRAKRPISAKEAMQKAIEDEKRAAAEAAAKKALARAEAERAKAARASQVAEEAAAKAKAEAATQLAAEQAAIKAAASRLQAAPAAAPAAPVRLQDAAVVLANRLPGVTVRMAKPVSNRDVFHALWTAHRARAVAEGNLALMVSADVLLDAARRVPEGALCSARIDYAGEGHAAWVDTASGCVLGIASPADVYLAGL